MLQRKALMRMQTWKSSPSRRALLLTGARQIGKTYLARHFATENYDHVVEFNLILDRSAKEIFAQAANTKEILQRLSLLAGKDMIPGKTCIFIDEIQMAPEAMTAIKGLVDQGDYDFILSGSLLGVELKNIRSNPVGSVSTIHMYPLDFEEFCWANGVASAIFDSLSDSLGSESPVDAFIHEQMSRLFREYLVIGGMPDAVSSYVESNNLDSVREVQTAIRDWYRTDISQYCQGADALKAKDAFDLIPAELNNPNKRFVLKNLHEMARLRTYEDAFLWLTRANVALAAFNIEAPVMPLLASKSRNLFKLFYSDVGLLANAYSRGASLDILSGGAQVNHGATVENAIAQELTAHGYALYYFNSKKHGEVDFVIEDADGKVIPIEVKSGKDYRRHRAMNNILDIPDYRLDSGYVLAPGNIERQGKVLYLPTYMASLLNFDS